MAKKKPDFYIYEDPQDESPDTDRPDWKIVGAGWFHGDGCGGNIQMDNGSRFIMRAPKAKNADADPQV